MSENNENFKNDLTVLFNQIKNFHEKYNCSASCIQIFDEGSNLYTTSSFPPGDRVKFLNYVCDFIQQTKDEGTELKINQQKH
jgi:hypothetical protein